MIIKQRHEVSVESMQRESVVQFIELKKE